MCLILSELAVLTQTHLLLPLSSVLAHFSRVLVTSQRWCAVHHQFAFKYKLLVCHNEYSALNTPKSTVKSKRIKPCGKKKNVRVTNEKCTTGFVSGVSLGRCCWKWAGPMQPGIKHSLRPMRRAYFGCFIHLGVTCLSPGLSPCLRARGRNFFCGC